MNLEAYFKITYGLFVVSSGNEGEKNAFIANTAFQVTAEPPQFAIACSKNNASCELIQRSNVYAISILQRDTKPEIMGTFGYKSGVAVDKFKNFHYKIGQTGVPILLDDVVAYFECEVVQSLDVGSHILFIGKVVDGDLLMPDKEPLTYTYYREVKKGMSPKNSPTYIDRKKLEESKKKNYDKYQCFTCGYIYDPEDGDQLGGIKPGTLFSDLPDDWICPVCGTPKTDFGLYEE
jgi:flavin reductase (DIM6/NTAB) family NADH-FMN oxidoreductase RutF/rubredoxin